MKIAFSLEAPIRIDRYLSENLLDLTRSQINKLIKNNSVYLDDQLVKKASQKISAQGIISIDVSLREEKKIQPWNNLEALEIIFENPDYLILNKPHNLVMYPGSGKPDKTLVNILVYKYQELANLNTIRPGIVHRLDKDTTGVVVVAKNNKFFLHLQEQFTERKVEKKYYGLVEGNFQNKIGEIRLPIARNKTNRKKMAVDLQGKEAITIFEVKERFKHFDLMEFKLITGRTHQIRVHCKFLAHAIYNDRLYGKLYEKANGNYLHAYYIKFRDLDNKVVSYSAKLPNYFSNKLKQLESEIK